MATKYTIVIESKGVDDDGGETLQITIDPPLGVKEDNSASVSSLAEAAAYKALIAIVKLKSDVESSQEGEDILNEKD